MSYSEVDSDCKCENYKCSEWSKDTIDHCTDNDTVFYGCPNWVSANTTQGAFYRLGYAFENLWLSIKEVFNK